MTKDENDFDFEDSLGESENSGPEDSAPRKPPGFAPPPPPLPSKASPKASSPKKGEVSPPIPSQEGPSSKVINLASDVPVQLVAVFGKKSITVKDLMNFKMGQVIDFNRYPNEAIDLAANGRLMAKGELVEVDGKLGIRLIKVFE